MYFILRTSLRLFTKIDGFTWTHVYVVMARRANHRDVMSKSAPGRFSPAKNMPERRCLNEYINLSPNDFETWAKPHWIAVIASFILLFRTAVHIRENDDAALLEPLIGAFLCVAERADLMRTLVRKNRQERFFTTAGNPQGEAHGRAAYKLAWS